MTRVAAWLLAAGAAAASATVLAVPVQPTSDDEVVERLPGVDRQRRLEAAARAGDVEAALSLSGAWLDQARTTGDPRPAGRALGLVQRWADPATAPPAVLLRQAVLAQHLHDFDGAASRLEALLAREPGQAQGWLTLATVRRVQGRYEAADTACQGVLAAGARLHGDACLAENLALRGAFGPARASLRHWLAERRTDAPTRAWLLTTLAEAEERAGHGEAARQAFRQALAEGGDDYVAVAYADMLLRQGRPAEALGVLAGRTDSDAVLVRRVMAGRQAGAPGAADDAARWRERLAPAEARPGGRPFHARERALSALRLEGDPAAALRLARANVALQREPADLLLLAEAARAAGDGSGLDEARQWVRRLGLVDRRLDAVLDPSGQPAASPDTATPRRP